MHRDDLLTQTGLPEIDFHRYVMEMLARGRLVELEGGLLKRR